MRCIVWSVAQVYGCVIWPVRFRGIIWWATVTGALQWYPFPTTGGGLDVRKSTCVTLLQLTISLLPPPPPPLTLFYIFHLPLSPFLLLPTSLSRISPPPPPPPPPVSQYVFPSISVPPSLTQPLQTTPPPPPSGVPRPLPAGCKWRPSGSHLLPHLNGGRSDTACQHAGTVPWTPATLVRGDVWPFSWRWPRWKHRGISKWPERKKRKEQKRQLDWPRVSEGALIACCKQGYERTGLFRLGSIIKPLVSCTLRVMRGLPLNLRGGGGGEDEPDRVSVCLFLCFSLSLCLCLSLSPEKNSNQCCIVSLSKLLISSLARTS